MSIKTINVLKKVNYVLNFKMIIIVMNYAINYQQMIHQRHVFFMKISVLKHMLIAKIMILMLT